MYSTVSEIYNKQVRHFTQIDNPKSCKFLPTTTQLNIYTHPSSLPFLSIGHAKGMHPLPQEKDESEFSTKFCGIGIGSLLKVCAICKQVEKAREKAREVTQVVVLPTLADLLELLEPLKTSDTLDSKWEIRGVP
jgi:hypothetical protein